MRYVITVAAIGGGKWWYAVGSDAWEKSIDRATIFDTRQQVETVRTQRGLGRFINVEELDGETQ
jgi:hypothetical protein